MFAAKFITAVALALVAVNAQDSTSASPTDSGVGSIPSGIAGITPCILGCVTEAAAGNGCSGPTDLQCICTNTAFQTAAQTCLTSKCTAEEQAASLELQKSQCAAVGGASTTAGGASSGSPTSTSPSGSKTPTGSTNPSGSKSSGANTPTNAPAGGNNGAASMSGNVVAAAAIAFIGGVVAL